MNLITKLQPVFIILAALFGLLLGYATEFGDFSVHFIEPFLMILLFFVFLSVDGQKMKHAFHNLRFTLTATLINFVWTPLLTFGLGILFFRDSLDLQMGLMMLMVTPCTDWYLVFTELSNGNVVLGASILPLNLLLQILLLPIYLLVFFGNSVQFSIASTLISIVIVLIIPFTLSFILKHVSRKNQLIGKRIDKLKDAGDTFQLVFLCIAVISMFASESKNVIQNYALLLKMLSPLAIFFIINFVLVQFLGRRTGMVWEDIIALNFTTLARNSPLSLAIAVAAFPDRPLISLALVIGPLIELPALSIISAIQLQLSKDVSTS